MGMFDWVYVEHDLPDKQVDGELEFQSKSPNLPNLCSELRIKEDGRLFQNGSFERFTGGFEIHGTEGEYFCTFEEGILQSIVSNQELR